MPFPEQEPIQKSSEINFGGYVSFGTFWARNIVEGNPYTLSPISSSGALRFLYKPTEIPQRRKKNQEVSFGQAHLFEDYDFEDPRTNFELPPLIYQWLSEKSEEGDKKWVLEKIKEEFGEKYSKVLNSAIRYYDLTEKFGPKKNFLKSRFFLQIGSIKGSSYAQGEKDSKVIYLSGNLGEIREIERENTLVRIRQNRGKPTEYDAIRLTLDVIAYMAMSKESGQRSNFPNLVVFNLTDGKNYVLNSHNFNYMAKNVINAINFSDLALRSGYLKIDDENNPFGISADFVRKQAKKVYVKTTKGRQILTAEETFKKARNCLKRINGELPYSERLFEFRQIA